MKGYNTSNGYMGYVEGKYILFASEQEYFEFMHYRGYIYVILELVLKNLGNKRESSAIQLPR